MSMIFIYVFKCVDNVMSTCAAATQSHLIMFTYCEIMVHCGSVCGSQKNKQRYFIAK